jgi:hypothetical protein
VQAVRESLFAESVEQADLILRTFGLVGLDLESEWQDYDPKVEIRQQVLNADNEPFLDIASHLNLDGFSEERKVRLDDLGLLSF